MKVTDLFENIETYDKGEIRQALSKKVLYDAFDNIPYFLPNEADSEFHIAKLDKKGVIGLAGLQENPHNSTELWIKFVSVREEYRNKGIATELVNSIFKFTKERGYSLKKSSYTDLGGQYLPHVFDRVSQKYPDIEIKE